MDGLGAPIEQIDACIEAVAGSLLNAVVAGSILLATIYALCRLFPRIPAAIRFGFWWIGCARILISLACSVTIPLVLVIPRALSPRLAAPTTAVRSILHQMAPKAVKVAPLSPRAVFTGVSIPGDSAAAASTGSEQSPAPGPAGFLSLVDARAAATDALVLAWAIGVALQFRGLLRASAVLRRLVRAASPTLAPAEVAQIAQRIRLRHAISWRTSAEVTSPLVVGFLRPTLIFPTDFPARFLGNELQIAVAHELAHVRRADVLLSIVPTLAKCLFFFNPLAHLAYRECVNCREEACDAIAIAATSADPACYAALLLKTALIRRVPSPLGSLAAPGMAAAHFAQLKRRLEAVGAGIRPCPSPITATVLAAAAVAFAVPYRVVLAASTALKRIAQPVVLPSYDLTDLGTLGGRSSDAMAINDNGEIVGSANNNRRSTTGHAFLYNTGGMVDLGASIPYRHSVAAAINGRGQVVADAFDRNGRALSIIWNNGTAQPLQSLTGYRFSRPAAINGSGDVVGTAQNPWPDERGAFRTRAFVNSAGVVHDLGTLGGPYSAATAINAAGEIVGKADLPIAGGETSTTHAFERAAAADGHSPGALRDLGTLPGGANSVATAINDVHVIAGVSEVAGGLHHGFLVAGYKMADLGTLPGTDSSRAYGLNNAGFVIGSAYSNGPSAQNSRRAVLWLPNRTAEATPRIVDLNEVLPPGSPWFLESARAINSRGQIVGQGMINGERRAFLLTPR